MKKHKYVRLEKYNSIIVFPEFIEHSRFKFLDPVSAGFCFIDTEKQEVDCYGESVSLGLKSMEDDSKIAKRQFFYE